MIWKCRVCGYEHEGKVPPKECPICSSSGEEFTSNKISKEYNGEKIDVLLINGSAHSSHNTGISLKIAEKHLKNSKLKTKSINLADYNIKPCWCCYSMRDSACTYPCRNQGDDIHILHEMLVNSRAVIIFSPINWNSMSSRLKLFLDRLTSLQNLGLLKKKSKTLGKILGISVNGHEDGALKTALDIFLYFEEMGFILAPFSIQYRTHNSQYDTKEDHPFFEKDAKLNEDISGLVNNVVEMLKLNLESKLEGKIKSVCE